MSPRRARPVVPLTRYRLLVLFTSGSWEQILTDSGMEACNELGDLYRTRGDQVDTWSITPFTPRSWIEHQRIDGGSTITP